MAEANDTENPPEHQQSPPPVSKLLGATKGQIALLENFLNYQLDLAAQVPTDHLTIKSSQLEAFIKLLSYQIVNIKATLHDDLTAIRLNLLDEASPDTPLSLKVDAFKAQLKELLDAVIALSQLRQEIVDISSTSAGG